MTPPIVIAGFFDILGFKELIELSEREWDTAIEKVKLIDSMLRKLFTPRDSGGLVRFFSDNVYISVPLENVTDVRPDNLFWFFRQLYEMQWFFVEVGIFIRGGISVGTQYVTDTTLFGTALVRAYLAESKYAKVPRIVVDQSFIAALDNYENSMTGHGASNTRLLIRKDEDGILFMDYMSLWDDWTWFDSFKTEKFKTHREQIIASINGTTDETTLNKYLWLAKYHNVYGTQNDAPIDLKKAFKGKLPSELLTKNILVIEELS